MEQQGQPTPSPEMSPQGPEQAPVVQNGEAEPQQVEAPAAQEVARDSGEAANQNAGMTLPPVQQTPVTPVQNPVVDDTTKQKTVVVPDAPEIADDVDLIETEWVNKAKKIVHDTKDDPRQQNKEVSALKADYMKKRYGKDIKLSDD